MHTQTLTPKSFNTFGSGENLPKIKTVWAVQGRALKHVKRGHWPIFNKMELQETLSNKIYYFYFYKNWNFFLRISPEIGLYSSNDIRKMSRFTSLRVPPSPPILSVIRIGLIHKGENTFWRQCI